MDDAFQIGDTVFFLANNTIYRGVVGGRKITEYAPYAVSKLALGGEQVTYLVGNSIVPGEEAYASVDELICDLTGNMCSA